MLSAPLTAIKQAEQNIQINRYDFTFELWGIDIEVKATYSTEVVESLLQK